MRKTLLETAYIFAISAVLILFLLYTNWHIYLVFFVFLFAGLPILSFFQYKNFSWIERILMAFFLADSLFFIFHLLVLWRIPLLKQFTLFWFLFPMLLYFLRWNHVKSIINNSDLKFSEKNAILILLLTSAFILSPAARPHVLSDTDYLPEAWQGLNINHQIERSGSIALWTKELLVGYPRFIYDGFISYEKFGFLSMIFGTKNYFGSINSVLIISFLFMLLGVYRYCRYLGGKEYWSLIPPWFILGSYLFIQLLGLGYLRAIMSISIYPLMLICSINIKENWRLLLMISILSFFHHPMYGLITIIFCCLLNCLKYKSIDETIKPIMYLSSLFFIITLFWLIPALTTKEYSFMEISKVSSASEKLIDYFNFLFNLIVNEDEYFWIFFITGLIATIIYNPSYLYVLLTIILYGLIYVIPIIGKVLNSIDLGRLRWLWFMLFSIFIISLQNIKNKKLAKLLFAIIVIFLVLKLITPHQQIKKFYFDERSADEIYNFSILSKLKTLPEGRIVTYGAFAAVFDNFLQIISQKDIIHYGMYHGQHMNLFEKTRSKDGNYTLPDSTQQTLNYLRASFTPFIVVSECSKERPGAKTTLRLYKEANNELEETYSEDCIRVFKIKNISFIEKITLASVPENESLYMSWNNSWKAYNAEGAEANMIIQKEEELTKILDPEPLQYQRQNNEHIIIYEPTENSWIVIKEQYHPYWKAHQSEKELTVYKSNIGTMLVKAETNEKIDLKFQNPGYVKWLALLSMLTLFLLMLL
ncbi:hypothetical protein HYV79_00860 [Candidatus Woesearchaeota archaeon]|nr:hypothetical protein [Candidatus Woesearchaeota archaeon]